VSSLTPHGKGFSFLDRFEITGERKGRGTKWLDPKLGFFADHFPEKPLMPAVLLIECAAQTAGGLWASVLGAKTPAHFVLVQVLQFKVLHPVLPDATVITDVSLENTFGALAQFSVVLTVNQQEVARGKIVLGSPSPES
jgi:3-hydroxymyristoyl/3-hydroxydecanoyl-(acyl carrier protein) dehydratase